ncbi:MAG: hypothetical protein KF893_12995 [Caldilineaceae bacterium]|nr:hypothetical protein [Caldilineaceae bacterium]
MARTLPIYEMIDELPTRSLTVRVLKTLDWIVPGQWENVVGFTETIQSVTGETNDAVIQKIGERAVVLYNDKRQGYQRAMSLYRAVDKADRLAIGPLAMLNTAGSHIRWLGFLNRITPKAENLQALDLGLKVVAELSAFCLINGIPGDSIGDFVKSLNAYSKESLMRMAALIALDGILPLGPNFLEGVSNALNRTKPQEMAENKLYSAIRNYLPGGSESSKGEASAAAQPAKTSKYTPKGAQTRTSNAASAVSSKYSPNPDSHLEFVRDSFGEVSGWMNNMVSRTQMTREKVADSLGKIAEVSDTKLDYVAAFLDMSTYYFEHTGTQTLARRLIERAVNEI